MEVNGTPDKRPKYFSILGPPTVLTSFAFGLAATVLNDLIVYKTCLVSMGFNETECRMLRNNSHSQEAQSLEIKVEPYASMIITVYYTEKISTSVVLCLFLGPWSDKGGRRPPLLAAMCGLSLMFLAFSVIAELEVSPWFILAAAIPSTVAGSSWTIKLMLNCYASDTSTGKMKLIQMALLETSYAGGTALGGLIGPVIFNNYGHANVFRVAASSAVSALVYAYFCMPETIENASKASLQSFFKISLIKNAMNSTIRKREGFDRLIVWPAIVVLAIDALNLRGDETVQFLFTRARLGWTVEQYSHFSVTHFSLRFTGLCFLHVIEYVSSFPDTLLSVVSTLSSTGGAITMSLTWKSWHMYLASSIAVLGATTSPVTRSAIARSVPAKDIGKVFSFVSLLEMFGSASGPPLYSLIHSNYLPPIHPTPVYIFASSLLMSSIICSICIHMRLMVTHSRHHAAVEVELLAT